jgi:acyl carrier protein
MNPIQQDLRQFVIETFLFGTDDGQLSNDDSFIENGLIDSMGILNLISYVEKQYGIHVADSDLVPEKWDSVNRVANYVASKRVPEQVSLSNQRTRALTVAATCVQRRSEAENGNGNPGGYRRNVSS